MIKLKEGVILKEISDNITYALDCSVEEESFFKFEGASKVFLEKAKDGITKDELIKFTLSEFEDAAKDQVQKDIDNFLETINGFNLLVKS